MRPWARADATKVQSNRAKAQRFRMMASICGRVGRGQGKSCGRRYGSTGDEFLGVIESLCSPRCSAQHDKGKSKAPSCPAKERRDKDGAPGWYYCGEVCGAVGVTAGS